MPDAEGVNTNAREGSEVGPEENLMERVSPESTGTQAPPNKPEFGGQQS
jgi:hypothetical protein